MTNSKANTAKAVKKWCRTKKFILDSAPRHIHPIAYVIGYSAPGALVVAIPWMDSEPHLQDFDKANPITVVRNFDDTLKPGDWCSTAYVRHGGVQETVAIPVVA